MYRRLWGCFVQLLTQLACLVAAQTRLLALALGLPDGFVDEPGRFDAPQLFLRLLRYAPEPSAPHAGVFAAGAHTDYGMLTLLATDAQPGLQIQPRLGAVEDPDAPWVDVPPRHGAFIVNLGDLLERWTNGRVRSTRHRVVNTTGKERLSMPFFFGARRACGAAVAAAHALTRVWAQSRTSRAWSKCCRSAASRARRRASRRYARATICLAATQRRTRRTAASPRRRTRTREGKSDAKCRVCCKRYSELVLREKASPHARAHSARGRASCGDGGSGRGRGR